MGTEQRVVENCCRLEEPNQFMKEMELTMMRLFLEQLEAGSGDGWEAGDGGREMNSRDKLAKMQNY